MQRRVAGPPHGIEQGKDPADMVKMQMGDEELVQVHRVDAETKQIPDRPAPNVENERITVAKLHQQAGCALCDAQRCWTIRRGHRDAHLILGEALTPRDVVLRVFPT